MSYTVSVTVPAASSTLVDSGLVVPPGLDLAVGATGEVQWGPGTNFSTAPEGAVYSGGGDWYPAVTYDPSSVWLGPTGLSAPLVCPSLPPECLALVVWPDDGTTPPNDGSLPSSLCLRPNRSALFITSQLRAGLGGRIFLILNDTVGYFGDNSLDFTVALSTMEHIPGSQDYVSPSPFMPSKAFYMPPVPYIPEVNTADSYPDSVPANAVISDPDRFQCIITNFTGSQNLGMPSDQVLSASWILERYGGYGNGTLSTVGNLQDNLFPIGSMPTWLRVEFRVDGITRYRGFITRPSQRVDSPLGYNYTVFGLFVMAGEITVKRNIAFGVERDVSTVFGDVATSTILPQYDGLLIGTQPLGFTVTFATYRNSSFKDFADSLVQSSGNAGMWGFYHSENDYTGSQTVLASDPANLIRPNVLVMQPLSSYASPTHAFMVPSSGVSGFTCESDLTKVTNCLEIFGGPRLYPNLLYNADFRLPVGAGNGLVNLLVNGDFSGAITGTQNGNGSITWQNTIVNPPQLSELHTPQATASLITVQTNAMTGWAFSNGASIKQTGNQDGNTYAGAANMVELKNSTGSNPGSSIEQTVTGLTLVPGQQYRLSYYYRLEQEAFSNTIKNTVTLLTTGGSVSTLVVSDTWQNTVGVWTNKEYIFTIPADGHTYTVASVFVQTIAGATPSKGTLLDFFELYNMAQVGQAGWLPVVNGTAQILNQNWVCTDACPLVDTGVSVLLQFTASDADGEDIDFQMTNNARYNVTGGEQMRAIAVLKNPAAGTVTSPKMQLYMEGYNPDGTGDSTVSTTTISTGALDSDANMIADGIVPLGNGWGMVHVVRNCPQAEAQGGFILRFRGSGYCQIGCVSVRDNQDQTWCPDGNYFARIYSNDSRLDYASLGYVSTSAATAIQNSVLPPPAGYNVRPVQVQQASLCNDTDALGYALRYFPSTAIPEQAPELTMESVQDTTRYYPGETVYMGGDFGLSLIQQTQAIARVREKWEKGSLQIILELSREKRDEAVWFLELVDSRVARTSATSGGDSAAQPGAAQPTGGGGGGSWIGVQQYFGAMPHDATLTTAHDSWSTPGGVHMTAGDRFLLGAALLMGYTFDLTISYPANTLVVTQNGLYVSLVNSNLGNQPETSPSKWYSLNPTKIVGD